MAEPIAQHTFRATLVTALAKLLSVGATKAATYDCRVGTSISTRASRAKNRRIASFAEGANGTAISSKLEGKCVNTDPWQRIPVQSSAGQPPRQLRPLVPSHPQLAQSGRVVAPRN